MVRRLTITPAHIFSCHLDDVGVRGPPGIRGGTATVTTPGAARGSLEQYGAVESQGS